jgi:hypothetical protein
VGGPTILIPGDSGITVSAGTASGFLSEVVFSNSNGVSFGLNGSTITASAVGGTGAGIAVADSVNTVATGTVVFANSNGVSFGLNGSTLSASIHPLNVSAGTTSNNLSAVTFSNSNGISFGLNGSVLTASANVVGFVSAFSQDADFVTNFPISNAVLSLQKLSIGMNLRATQLALLADVRLNLNSSGAVTVQHAIYSLNQQTAILASSGSRVFSWTSGGLTNNTAQYGGVSGTRYRSVPVSYNVTPGDYLCGMWISAANNATVNIFGRAGMHIVGTFDGLETATFLNGTSVSTVAVFPNTIGATDTNYARTGFSAALQPGVILLGT